MELRKNCRSATVGATPLLASRQGGVAERSRKYREASADRRGAQARKRAASKERTGWFSDKNKRKTTPSASASVASRNFLDDADTPPCRDARRGIALDCIYS